MRIAYIDAPFGAAGDMLLGAALHAGAGLDAVRAALQTLPLEGWTLDAHSVQRAGFAATKADVTVEDPQPPRTARAIVELIAASPLPERVRDHAVATFELLGDAEAAVHGVPSRRHGTSTRSAASTPSSTSSAPSPGSSRWTSSASTRARCLPAAASCGRAACRRRPRAGALPAGGGLVRAAHGRLPVPAPAVLEIAARCGATLLESRPGEPVAELVTPTAMAIIGATADFTRPAMALERTGIGAGSKDFEDWPNVVRLWIGETSEAAAVRPLALIETNVDDMPGEHLPFLEARLRDAGALDVWWTAVQMKKGRPGLQITAVAARGTAEAVAAALLEHSPTLGVRATELVRYEADREVLEFESSLGPAAVKVKRLPGAPPRVAPEYESARAIAERSGLPIAEVYATLSEEALARLE